MTADRTRHAPGGQGAQDSLFDSLVTPVVILARPQMGENIGAAARAMKNCGLHELRLIAPRDGWPNPAAWPMATVGTDILEQAQIFDDLPTALHDISYLLATSARPRDMEKPSCDPRHAAGILVTEQLAAAKQNRRVGLLFGAERSGLDNHELVLADCVAQAPLQKGASSLNLAQAVLLMAWEWRMAALAGLAEQDSTAPANNDGLSEPASLGQRDYFMTRLEGLLDANHFFGNPDMAPTVKRNLRCLFSRARPTEQELKTMHGIISLFQEMAQKP